MTYQEASKRIGQLKKKMKSKDGLTADERAELEKLVAEFPRQTKRGGNDFSFWNKFPMLLKDATNIPFNFIPGTEYKLKEDVVPLANLVVCKYMPTPGICENSTDAFNLWSRELYLELHRKYRGLGAYSWEDLAVVTFCILDVFGRLSEAEFIYGIMNNYPINNRIRPEGVLRAMGFSTYCIDSIKNNLADFRYRINQMIIKSVQLCLPKGMSYLKNRVSLNAFMYPDSKDKRASYIKFVQDYAFRYDATFPTGGAAIGYKRNWGHTNYVTYLAEITADLEALLGDTDVARICSDLLAAFGDGGIDKLTTLPENYDAVVMYDEPILSKFHNIETLSGNNNIKIGSEIYSTAEKTYLAGNAMWTEGESVLLQQQGGNVVFSVQIAASNSNTTYYKRMGTDRFGYGTKLNGVTSVAQVLSGDRHIIDCWHEEAGQDIIAEDSLWKRNVESIAFIDDSTPGVDIAQSIVESCGPELITEVSTYRVVFGDVPGTVSAVKSLWVINHPSYGEMTCDVSKFDWHPISVVVRGVTLDGTHRLALTNPFFFGDLDNCAPITSDAIKRIHDACLLSSFVFDGQTLGK